MFFQNKTGNETRPSSLLTFIDDLLNPGTAPDEAIAGFLPSDAVVGIVAPSQSGKSLLATQLASCVATGQPFFGRETKQGLVVYLCGEGKAGLKPRLQAIELHHQLGLRGAPFAVLHVPTSLLDTGEVECIKQAIAQAEATTGLTLTLIVVDTLARFLAPGDESKAQDMSRFLNAVDYLRSGATAVICHHTGHDQSRARGSSSWTASLDVEYFLERKGDLVTVTCAKMKDGEAPEPMVFRIRQADTLQVRKGGQPVRSVVLVPHGNGAAAQPPSGRNQQRLLSELQKQVDQGGSKSWTEPELRAVARGLGMQKNSAADAVRGLCKLGHLLEADGFLHLSSDGANPKVRNHAMQMTRTPD